MKYLGFCSLSESFNVIGLALGIPSSSIKNYRDEFDPLFPDTPRAGWRNRQVRPDRQEIYGAYGNYGLEDLARLLKTAIHKNPNVDMLLDEPAKQSKDENYSFANRLITGQAAEQYFWQKYCKIPTFEGMKAKNTTNLGCGFDFRLTSKNLMYAVEVKGIRKIAGGIVMTNKEKIIASDMRENYFLFVVKNLQNAPQHDIYRNPFSQLEFSRKERKSIQIEWATNIS